MYERKVVGNFLHLDDLPLRRRRIQIPSFHSEVRHATHPVRFFLCFPHTVSWALPPYDWWHYPNKSVLARVSIRWLPGLFHVCSWRRHEDRHHELGQISRAWSCLLRSGPVRFKLVVSWFQVTTEGGGDMRPRRARIMTDVFGKWTDRMTCREEGGIHTILVLVVMALSKVSLDVDIAVGIWRLRYLAKRVCENWH